MFVLWSAYIQQEPKNTKGNIMEGTSSAAPAPAVTPAPAPTTAPPVVQGSNTVDAGLGAEAMAQEGQTPVGQEMTPPVVDESLADILPEGETAEGEIAPEGAEMNDQGELLALAAEIFPDRQFESEAEAMEAVREFTTAAKEFEAKTAERDKKLLDIFNSNQELVQLIRMINEGATFTQALPHVVNVDDLAPVQGDPDYDTWNQAKTERSQRLADQEKAQAEIAENLNMTTQEMEKFAKDEGMEGEEAAEFFSMVDKLMESVASGKLTTEHFSRLKKGMFYDRDVQDANETAEIRGRNEAIEEKITKEETRKGDGLPDVKSAATESTSPSADEENPAAQLGRSIESFVQSKRF